MLRLYSFSSHPCTPILSKKCHLRYIVIKRSATYFPTPFLITCMPNAKLHLENAALMYPKFCSGQDTC